MASEPDASMDHMDADHAAASKKAGCDFLGSLLLRIFRSFCAQSTSDKHGDASIRKAAASLNDFVTDIPTISQGACQHLADAVGEGAVILGGSCRDHWRVDRHRICCSRAICQQRGTCPAHCQDKEQARRRSCGS